MPGKSTTSRNWLVTLTIAGVLALLAFTPTVLLAADNQATGNIAGVDADLDDSNTFTLNSVTLALVKAAFLSDGTALTSGISVPKGTLVKFMIYVDNTTAVQVNTVNVADVLDATFAYQAGTIKVDASQNTGATVANIFTAVNAASALTDAVSGVDEVGYTAGTTTISAGSAAGNTAVNVPASKVWAMLFNVVIQ